MNVRLKTKNTMMIPTTMTTTITAATTVTTVAVVAAAATDVDADGNAMV